MDKAQGKTELKDKFGVKKCEIYAFKVVCVFLSTFRTALICIYFVNIWLIHLGNKP